MADPIYAPNVDALTAYVDENKMALIKKSILGGRTLEFITVQPGIKSSATINILDGDLIASAGGCGWDNNVQTTLSQQTLSVCPLKVNEATCLDTLEQYYTQKLMNPGSYNTEIPYQGLYAEDKADRINALIDDLIWKGDSEEEGNLALCDGYIKLATTTFSGSVVNGNVDSVSSITPSNIIDIVDGIVASVPTDVINKLDLILFVGYDFYREYAKALRDANLFHYTGAENQGGDFIQFVPGTNVRMIAVRGLNGTKKAFLSPASNLYFGTDLLADAEDFNIFYNMNDDEVRFRAKWKQGVMFAFPEFVVYFELV
jgi:hypothetical protein